MAEPTAIESTTTSWDIPDWLLRLEFTQLPPRPDKASSFSCSSSSSLSATCKPSRAEASAGSSCLLHGGSAGHAQFKSQRRAASGFLSALSARYSSSMDSFLDSAFNYLNNCGKPKAAFVEVEDFE